MTTRIELPRVADTEAFGRRLGEELRAGDLVLLSGPLGAGKTALTRGIAAGMNVGGRVQSPTFIIAREHPARPGGVPLIHVDAYRLGGRLDLDILDLDTELTEAAVVIEWGEGLAEQLADTDHLLIRLERRPDDTRVATLHPRGERWSASPPDVTRLP